MMNLNLKSLNKSDVLVLILWMSHPLLSYIGILFGYAIPFFRTSFISIVVIITILFSIKSVTSYIRQSDWAFYFACAFIALLSYINPNNADALNSTLPNFLFESLPLFFVGLIADFNKIEKQLYVISFTSVIAQAVFSFVYMRSQYGMMMSAESMSYSYWILPHVLMMILISFKRPKIYNIVVALLGAFLMISYGSRGPLLCCLIFISLYIVFIVMKNRNTKMQLVLVLAGLLIISEFSAIFDLVSTGVDRLGMSNRIFRFMENDDITNSSGREDLYTYCLSALKDSNAIFGYGLCGDRYFCSGAYVHNIFIEFWTSFGYLGGSLLLILFLAKIVKGAKNAPDSNSLSFLLLLCALTCQLLVSGSFVSSESFFYLLGFAIAQTRNGSDSIKQHSSI